MIVKDQQWSEMKSWLSEVQKSEPDARLKDVIMQFMDEFSLDSWQAAKLIGRYIVEEL